jgi:two-component system chemotaxis response regulator CheY
MKKVLIVDDSLFMRRVLKDLLQDVYVVAEADSAATALKQYEAEHPDLVLLDIIMPGGDEAGIGVLQSLMDAHPDAKIVMVTALGQDMIIEQCRKLGARGYVTKPFDEQKVRQVVAQQLA